MSQYDSTRYDGAGDEALSRALGERLGGGAGALPEPARLLARVRRRRWTVRARRAGAMAAVVAVGVAAWLAVRGPAPPGPSAPERPIAAAGPTDSSMAAALASRAAPMGSGIHATVVARAGERPGSEAWLALVGP